MNAHPLWRYRMDADPHDLLGHREVLVLAAVLAGARHYPDLMDELGLSRSQLHASLHRLRHAGLVDWAPSRRGTLRPLVYPVRSFP